MIKLLSSSKFNSDYATEEPYDTYAIKPDSTSEIPMIDTSEESLNIIEFIKSNKVSSVISANKELIRFFQSEDGSIYYQLVELLADEVPIQLLIDAWGSKSVDYLVPLIDYIVSRKEM